MSDNLSIRRIFMFPLAFIQSAVFFESAFLKGLYDKFIRKEITFEWGGSHFRISKSG